LRADANVQMLACPDMVSLVEEGILSGDRAEKCVASYLSQLTPGYDALVLGCTHFPLLLPLIQKLTPAAAIIDSANAAAHAVAGFLSARSMLNIQKGQGADAFIVSADKERFARFGGAFLGFEISDKTEHNSL
jgi:glutamate racemase